jgi:hypothetical protein
MNKNVVAADRMEKGAQCLGSFGVWLFLVLAKHGDEL